MKDTDKHFSDVEKIAQTLARMSAKQRKLAVMMTNSFIAGLEAQRALRTRR